MAASLAKIEENMAEIKQLESKLAHLQEEVEGLKSSSSRAKVGKKKEREERGGEE